ncbi:MAG: TVP38/TMEM64 family protein [Oscillospiraceae bacterium]|nr:TVP38/TMEM64 family protein [Oscillospiraceae bacterium]
MKKKIIILLALAAAVLAYWLLFSGVSAEDMEAFISGFGPWAAPVYIAAFTLLPAFFFPVAVLALAGGLLFGLWRGAVYTFIGAVLNCSLMFWMARHVGRARIEALIQKRLSPQWQKRLNRLGDREGFAFLIILRLIPAVPYNLINYAYGLTGMSFGAYLLASAIGIIPGTFAFINIGDKALDVTSPDFWIAIGLLILLLVVTTLLGKILFPNQKQGENEHEEN